MSDIIFNKYDMHISKMHVILLQYWDFKGGYELTTQYKSGYTVYVSSVLISLLLGALAYF